MGLACRALEHPNDTNLAGLVIYIQYRTGEMGGQERFALSASHWPGVDAVGPISLPCPPRPAARILTADRKTAWEMKIIRRFSKTP